MIRTAMSLPGLQILGPRTIGSAPPLSSTGSCDKRSRGSHFSSRDFVCRTECHLTSESGSRGEDETAVPCPTDLGSQPPNRTSFSTSFKIHGGVYRIYPTSTQRAYGSDEQRPTSEIRKGEFDQTTFLCARSSSPIYIRGYLYFSSHPPPRGALELELRRCRHTGGLQLPRSSGRPHPSFPLAIPERRTWRIKRLALLDRRPFQARVPQFADNVNSHPDVAHGDSQPHPIGRGVETSHPTYSHIPLDQFADNVNSHPTPLGHGDPHTNPNRQRGKGKIPGSQRSASQVINHRTIS